MKKKAFQFLSLTVLLLSLASTIYLQSLKSSDKYMLFSNSIDTEIEAEDSFESDHQIFKIARITSDFFNFFRDF